jgi:hypothetical protein
MLPGRRSQLLQGRLPWRLWLVYKSLVVQAAAHKLVANVLPGLLRTGKRPYVSGLMWGRHCCLHLVDTFGCLASRSIAMPKPSSP